MILFGWAHLGQFFFEINYGIRDLGEVRNSQSTQHVDLSLKRLLIDW